MGKAKSAAKGGAKAGVEQIYVTKESFDKSMELLLDKLEGLEKQKVTAPETPEEKEVKAAGPNRVDTNPEWEDEARRILGDYLDHTEVQHEKSGGIKFTIVIKNEKSNAGAAYLDLVHTDRRTKEVASEGMNGVTLWCRLVRQNLKRTEKE